jgi:hypothetical protein
MTKLQTDVPSELARVINEVQIKASLKKGKAMMHLVTLALSNPRHPVRDFGDGKRVNCTLEVNEKFWADDAKEYRLMHGLTTKSGFFRDAIARGASVYLDALQAQ